MTQSLSAPALSSKILTPIVLVTALGYLVDVYDLLLFNVVRIKSLQDIGLTGDALTDAGLFIINMQMVGLILGGLVFGVLGDKIGRKSCLLFSILVYSLGTLGCAFIQDANQYAVLRFIAGFGLAGEVGIGISLITESVVKEKRGLATTLFCFIGISGAVLAAVAAEFLDWRACYLVGGLAGLSLLALRAVVNESELFAKAKQEKITRGDVRMIFANPSLITRYLACIFIGAPIYFAIGILWTLAPELGKAMGVVDIIKPTWAIGIGYTGMVLGDALVGLLSQAMKSRLTPILVCLVATGILLVAFFFSYGHGFAAIHYYAFCLLSGLSVGYWVNMVTIAAEQFGTNLRATAATSIPNFVRATLLPMNIILAAIKPDLGIAMAALLVGGGTLLISLWALTFLEETFHKDLDYTH